VAHAVLDQLHRHLATIPQPRPVHLGNRATGDGSEAELTEQLLRRLTKGTHDQAPHIRFRRGWGAIECALDAAGKVVAEQPGLSGHHLAHLYVERTEAEQALQADAS